ncbi:hypothetical protein MLD38_038208 [Melastoma candidum]|uniref:Uncharacterized protein n=1 Tax=Melastoma candidum TaxID=119954 RepID=A0ACB9KYW2_9MYRT|nr:hypothetical protein MLD38_038208 [Melastoma candidum]
METDVDTDSALQYASIQILSGQQRYDAYICVDNKVEKLLTGNLGHLLPFMPALKELYSKGSTCNFMLQLPENMHGSGWFTKLTFERFLCIVNSPSLVAKTKLINQEITQLEAGRKFQLSLFSKTGAGVPSSDTSRKDLLHAMDLRLEALTGELVAAFTQNASAIFSEKELISLADFTQLFGATDLENALHRFLEMSQKSWIADSKSENRNSAELVAKNRSKSGSEISVACSQPDPDEACVKYSVPPTKVAEIERQSSGGEEESSDSDGEGQWTSAERSRTLMRSALHRRSTSPMQRVQIGRSGSRRAVDLNIKLGYFPVRSATHAETCENDDEDNQGSDQISKKVENEIRKTRVQDKIRTFECRQTDQAVDIRKRRSSDFSVGATKSELRSWSSGSSHDEAEAVGKVSPLGNSGEAITEEPKASLAGNTEFQTESGNLHSSEAAKDEKMRENADQGSESISSSLYKDPTEEMSVSDRLASSTEWIQKNEVELHQMMMEMMENKNVMEKSELSRSQDIPVEQRGGFYDKYKQKRDERLRGKNTGSKAEKLAQFKAMQEVLNEKRAEMRSLDAKDGKRAIVKKPPKSLTNSSAAAKPKKENHVSLTAKKASARTASSLPAVRKSWPLTPTRTAGVSPANASRAPSPARIKPSRQKPLLVSSVPPSICSRLKQEQSPAKQKVVKQETRVRKPKDGEDEMPQSVPEAGRKGKAKLSKGSSPNNGSTVATAKLSFYNKGTRKSSVVPLDSKLTRKNSGSNPLLKKETKASETFMDDCQDSKEEHCHKQNAADSDMVNLMETADSPSVEPPGATNMEPDVLEIKAQECDKEESFGVGFDDGRNGLPRVMDAVSMSKQTEEEADISQMTWVKIEESTDIPPLEDDCTFEFIPRANIPPGGSLSPRVRHSLSQMLQEEEENSEPDTSEWRNAENPPSLRHQRNAMSKGLRKLLNKFARKGKGDVNLSGWSSPSTFLEGEDDIEDTKIQTMKSSDNLLKERMSESRDGISSSTGPTMAKATRSFFFLSSFRGSNRTGDA